MRVVVLSDIHANLTALEAVLAAALPADEVWHLGDVVGYGPDPDEVVARLRELGARGVRGNHDAAAVGGLEIEWFNPDARRAIEWTRHAITDATRAWLAALPERAEAAGVTLVHGSPRDPIREYVLDAATARAALAAVATPVALHGHTHVPAAWLVAPDGEVDVRQPGDGTRLVPGARRALLNPGSVGQPRDGHPAAAWLELDPATGAAAWHRTPYDVADVQARMRAAGLPEALAARLAAGR